MKIEIRKPLTPNPNSPGNTVEVPINVTGFSQLGQPPVTMR